MYRQTIIEVVKMIVITMLRTALIKLHLLS